MKILKKTKKQYKLVKNYNKFSVKKNNLGKTKKN